jgi:hypothetical protein
MAESSTRITGRLGRPSRNVIAGSEKKYSRDHSSSDSALDVVLPPHDDVIPLSTKEDIMNYP